MKKSDLGWLKRYRTLIISLCAVVVFITTYLLILPALALDKDKAEEQGGITITSEASDEKADASNVAVSEEKTEKTQEKREEIKSVNSQTDNNESDVKNDSYKEGKISFKGEDYSIDIAYDKDAQIPDGATLKVKEIKQNSEEYEGYLEDSAKELKTDQDNITFARFFDIEICKDSNKIEPKSTVQVKIEYDDALDLVDSAKLSVVHFAEKEESVIEPEVIEEVKINKKETEISYEQDSFSVTGTIITGEPVSGNKYAVIVKHGDKYYAVENDGSLQEVQYSVENNVAHVQMDYPIFWTYTQENGLWNLRVPTLAATFTYQNLPDDYYYRFINPNTDSGITEETYVMTDDQGNGITPKEGTDPTYNECKRLVAEQHTGYVSSCAMYPFSNHQICGWDNHYIGIDAENMCIKGNVSEAQAAEIYFAEVESVVPSANMNHTVNHIDISIQGDATLSVPLAYGTYYYKIGDRIQTLVVSEGNDVTLNLKKDQVPIQPEDMKHAEVTAYSEKSGILNNAFYITGYSQNHDNPVSTPQVRLEGSFKVADIDPYPIYGEMSQEQADDNLSEEQLKNRLDNRIYYTVTAKKEMTFNWEYEYAEGQKAQLFDEDGNELSSTVMVNLSKSFDYWDMDNECPPIKEVGDVQANIAKWQQGHILWNTSTGTGSGMDFKLIAHADETDGVVAVEITKYLRTTTGEVLHPKQDVTNQFIVYQKTDFTDDTDFMSYVNGAQYYGMGEGSPAFNGQDYTGIHAKTVTVGSTGEGMVYDYDVKQGMAYVKEDANSIKQEITDISNHKWKYVSTRTETEFVWRPEPDVDPSPDYRHVVNGTTSTPEVLGNYGTWNDQGVTKPLYNGFLEFFVYNVYEPVAYPVYLKKVDIANPTSDTGLAGAEFDLYGPYDEDRTSDTETAGTGRKETKVNMSPILTNENGIVKIGDLSTGIYYLYETKAPSGYNLPDGPIKITVDSSESNNNAVSYDETNSMAIEHGCTYVDKTDELEAHHQLVITNQPGVILPYTGGSGTWTYKIIGTLLIAAGGIWLTLRRRRVA